MLFVNLMSIVHNTKYMIGCNKMGYLDVPEKGLNKSIARYSRASQYCVGRMINATDIAHNIRIQCIRLRGRQKPLSEPLHIPVVLSIVDLQVENAQKESGIY